MLEFENCCHIIFSCASSFCLFVNFYKIIKKVYHTDQVVRGKKKHKLSLILKCVIKPFLLGGRVVVRRGHIVELFGLSVNEITQLKLFQNSGLSNLNLIT